MNTNRWLLSVCVCVIWNGNVVWAAHAPSIQSMLLFMDPMEVVMEKPSRDFCYVNLVIEVYCYVRIG